MGERKVRLIAKEILEKNGIHALKRVMINNSEFSFRGMWWHQLSEALVKMSGVLYSISGC